VSRLALAAVCSLALCACPKPGDDVDPKIKGDGHYLAGQAAYLKGDFATAHKEYAEVKALNPTDPRLPAAEGEVYLAEVKIAEAIESFETASKLDPRRGTNWSRLGYLYLLKGEKAKARTAIDKALAANPKDFNALDSLADLQLGEGKLDDAVKSLVAASESAPDGLDFVLHAAQELDKAKRGDEALAVLEGASKRGIKGAALFGELGDRYVMLSKLPEALEAYTTAAKADPKDPSWWELAGEVNVKLGNAEAAEVAFKDSIKVKDRGVVHVQLARLCLAKKDDACVKAEVDKALETSTGEETRETMELADLLAAVGRKKDALALLRPLSEENEQKLNLDLHLKTARLAKELKDEVTEKAACTRALSNGQAGIKCP